MWNNYLKLIIRTINQNKFFSFLNVLSLSVGITSFLLILFYIDYESTYDNFQPDVERTYRIGLEIEMDGSFYAGSSAPLAPFLKKKFPEVESVCRISRSSWEDHIKFQSGGNVYYERNCYLVDSSFFDFFRCEIISGSLDEFCDDPNNIIISNLTAKKYFNEEDAIGKSILIDDKYTFIVRAVFRDTPENTNLPFQALIPFSRIEDFVGGDFYSWGESNYQTYLKLTKNSSINNLSEKIKNESKNQEDYTSKYLNRIFFQPVKKIHVERVRGNFQPIANIKYFYIYWGIGVFILIVAMINFMNLMTTSYMKRAAEVGLRKVLGADFRKLVIQFMFESFALTLLAIFISIVLIESCIPFVNNFFNVDISLIYSKPKFIFILLGLFFSVSLVSGSYPSFYISKLNPANVLKKGFISSKLNRWVKNSLVVFQFIVAISLITSTIFIYQQLQFLKNMDVGYSKKNVVNIVFTDLKMRSQIPVFKNKLLQQPDFIAVSTNSFSPSAKPNYQTTQWEGKENGADEFMWSMYIDENFLSVYQIELLNGRNLTSLPHDVRDAYLINESAAKKLGWEKPIGKMISAWGNKYKGKVIGVINDFNFRSLYFPVEPCLFHLSAYGSNISVRLKEDNIQSSLLKIENIWDEVFPNFPIEYFFVEKEYNSIFRDELEAGKLLSYFAFLTILISCTGLFALVAVSNQQRRKELSIRKVYGASVSKILTLVFFDYGKLIILANIIAWPCTYYFLSKWLQNFEYRIQNYFWIFLLASVITFIISYITILSLTIKAANTNPAETLKSE